MGYLVRFLIWITGRGMPTYRKPQAIVVDLEDERLRRHLLKALLEKQRGA